MKKCYERINYHDSWDKPIFCNKWSKYVVKSWLGVWYMCEEHVKIYERSTPKTRSLFKVKLITAAKQ